MNPADIHIDLYTDLGVASYASPEEIKAAYREKVKLHHPDVGGDPEAFLKIQRAYDTLSDPEKRAHYDATGEVREGSLESAIDVHARDLFAKLMMDAINDPYATRKDIFANGRRAAQRDISDIETTIKNAEDGRLRILKLAGRIKAKDGVSRLPHDILDHALKKLDEAIAQAKNQIAVRDRFKTMLDAYEMEVEEVMPSSGFFITSSTSNWT